MDYLPIFLNIRQQPCVVIGGGRVAARKVALLLKAGGQVTVVAPTLESSLAQCLAQGRIVHHARSFRDSDLDQCRVVIAATDDQGVNAKVSRLAQQRHLPVNVADQPELCSFVLPAIVDRSPVVVAVSSGGTSPVLARLLRARLETFIPAAYGRLAMLLGGYRDRVKQTIQPASERLRFWERMLQGTVAEQLLAGREQEAEHSLVRALEHYNQGRSGGQGEVYLVGAGPGDPDLLTFRALRLMQQADVVLYDRLVAPQILDLVRREAEQVYVGKRRAFHSKRQQEINEIMVKLAKQGKRVLRLKGGDPFIFGRGGEEIETLAQEGIPFQVVPGITAASGCASYAGIPLTHRDYAQSVLFVTGHQKGDTIDLDWKGLVQERQTVVIYMGLVGLDVICRQLIQHGMAPAMPAALVQEGTTAQQRVLSGTLETLPAMVAAAQVKAPTLVIIGEVVRLREKLAWFEGDRVKSTTN